MEIITSDYYKGKVKLRVSDRDDLWYLSHIIEPGDLVRGKSTRKIKVGDSENAKMVKKTFNLQIEAETIDFSSDGSSLRINGKIKDGPEDIPKDSYQAISLDERAEFILEKKQWLSYQKQKLEEATEKKFNYLILLFDREEAVIALTKKFGYEILVELKGDVPKKSKNVEVKSDFQQELINHLVTYNSRYQPQNIIIASPAFFKEDLIKKIHQPELRPKIVLANCSSVDSKALNETLRQPELKEILKTNKAREEQLLIEGLLKEINKNQLAAYGQVEVQKHAEAGAIDTLLLTDRFFQQKREEGKYKELDNLMKLIDSTKGKIKIISSENDPGKRLDGLGGIAALLKYKLEW